MSNIRRIEAMRLDGSAPLGSVAGQRATATATVCATSRRHVGLPLMICCPFSPLLSHSHPRPILITLDCALCSSTLVHVLPGLKPPHKRSRWSPFGSEAVQGVLARTPPLPGLSYCSSVTTLYMTASHPKVTIVVASSIKSSG